MCSLSKVKQFEIRKYVCQNGSQVFLRVSIQYKIWCYFSVSTRNVHLLLHFQTFYWYEMTAFSGFRASNRIDECSIRVYWRSFQGKISKESIWVQPIVTISYKHWKFRRIFFSISGSIWLKNGKLIPGELINCPSNYWLQLSSMRVETQKLISVKEGKTFGRNFWIDA